MTTLPLELLPNDPWTTDNHGDQTPKDWTRESGPNNSPQLWATKQQNGQTVAAIVTRQPECVHKLHTQLPSNEQVGGTDALLWPGQTQVYKIFHGPSSTHLKRLVEGLTPGRKVKLKARLLPDVGDVARGPLGELEPDHCRCAIIMGIDSEARSWQTMKTRHDYSGVNRPWNLFEITSTVTQNGSILVEAEVQQNWGDDPTGVAWFFGPFTLEYIDSIPPPPPVPDPNQPPDTPPTPPNGHDPVPSIEELMAEVEAPRTEVIGLRDAVMRAKKLTFFVFIGDEDKLNIHKSRTLSEAMALGLETHTFGEGA